jgi:hypothetical protein
MDQVKDLATQIVDTGKSIVTKFVTRVMVSVKDVMDKLNSKL